MLPPNSNVSPITSFQSIILHTSRYTSAEPNKQK